MNLTDAIYLDPLLLHFNQCDLGSFMLICKNMTSNLSYRLGKQRTLDCIKKYNVFREFDCDMIYDLSQIIGPYKFIQEISEIYGCGNINNILDMMLKNVIEKTKINVSYLIMNIRFAATEQNTLATTNNQLFDIYCLLNCHKKKYKSNRLTTAKQIYCDKKYKYETIRFKQNFYIRLGNSSRYVSSGVISIKLPRDKYHQQWKDNFIRTINIVNHCEQLSYKWIMQFHTIIDNTLLFMIDLIDNYGNPWKHVCSHKKHDHGGRIDIEFGDYNDICEHYPHHYCWYNHFVNYCWYDHPEVKVSMYCDFSN